MSGKKERIQKDEKIKRTMERQGGDRLIPRTGIPASSGSLLVTFYDKQRLLWIEI